MEILLSGEIRYRHYLHDFASDMILNVSECLFQYFHRLNFRESIQQLLWASFSLSSSSTLLDPLIFFPKSIPNSFLLALNICLSNIMLLITNDLSSKDCFNGVFEILLSGQTRFRHHLYELASTIILSVSKYQF